jgi:hypothetical protein
MRKLILVAWLLLLPLDRAPGAPKLPGDAELKALAFESLMSFNQAVVGKDFTPFHKHIAVYWQAEVTPTKLKTLFQSYIDQGVDLSFIKGTEPTFQPAPMIDANEVLVLQGVYPTMPTKLDFRLKYIVEKGAWKLIGIKVEAKPTGAAGKLPSEEEAKELVQESLIAFNAALQTKSFEDFHKGVAVMWQKQITPARLSELFAGFIKAKVNFAGIASEEPTFTTPPAINADGLLELKGSYTKPEKVVFDLGYLYEDPEWKLIKINVHLPDARE